jgi:serine/threonine-protein kinase RsbW
MPVSEARAERLTLTLKSTMESVSKVEAAAEKLAREAGLDEDECFHVAMAAREAAVNAVLHGNEYDPTKLITASFENTGAALVITVADQGKSFDPDSLPDPLAPENLLRGAGRGIFLIRSYMDELRFRQLNPGIELTLVKRLPPAAENS